MRDLPHPFRATCGNTRRRHITAATQDLPEVCAQTAIGVPKGTLGVVVIPSLNVRSGCPLARPLARKTAPVRKLVEGENYLISTLAPASSNFFLMDAASSLFTPSLTVLGAPSTRSLASFKPRLVTSRTALMTLILLPPTSVSTTVNSVFSSPVQHRRLPLLRRPPLP